MDTVSELMYINAETGSLFDIYVHDAKITCVEHAGNMYDFMWVMWHFQNCNFYIVCNQLMFYFLVMCIFHI